MILLKVIEKKIVEHDFSEIIKKDLTPEEQRMEIERMFEFEEDKAQMNKMTNMLKNLEKNL